MRLKALVRGCAVVAVVRWVSSERGKDTVQGCISFEALKAYTTTMSASIVCASSVLHLKGMTGFFRSMQEIQTFLFVVLFTNERTNDKERF